MQFTSSTLLFALAVLTGVQGQGGSFVAVGNQYSGGGCTDSSLTFADPIFGNGNVCQPLDRSGTNPPIVSYKVLSVSAGCSGKSQNSTVVWGGEGNMS